jgi:hypothetical protein
MWVALGALACRAEAPDRIAPDRPALVAPTCAPPPAAVVAAIAPWAPPLGGRLAERTARVDPGRCPYAPGPGGWGALVVGRPSDAAVVVTRLWPDGPAEWVLTRPAPRDAEGLPAAVPSWQPDGALFIRWCDAAGCGCVEEVRGWDASPTYAWSCPDRPAPALPPGAVPWPDPVDREG